VFISAMIGFGLFSALSGFANTLEMLVFFRIMQGLCGGTLMPLSQTLLMQIFPKEKHAGAKGLWAMTTLIAPIAGPLLGGYLCDNYGWHWIFWVNVPIAMIVIPMLIVQLRKHETETKKLRVDGVGLGLLIVWVGALQLVLDLGKEHDWFESTMICVLAVVAVIGFIAFLIWELTKKEPIVDLSLFRHRGFAVASLTMPLAFSAFVATVVLVPLWLQAQMGYTATWAGYVAGMTGVLAVFMAPVAAKLAGKFDPRKLIFVGVMWLAAITLIRAGATPQMTFWQVAIWPLLLGIGVPMFFLPLNLVAMGSVDPKETASAAGILNFIRTMSSAVGTALAASSWDSASVRNQAELAGILNQPEATISAMEAGGFTHEQALASLTGMVQGQAVTLATNQVMAVAGIGFAVAALSIWLAPRPRADVDLSAVH